MTGAADRAPEPWLQLSDVQRAALAALAHENLFIVTMESRGRDSLDFYDVHVGSVRDALARAFLAGAGRANLKGLPLAGKRARRPRAGELPPPS